MGNINSVRISEKRNLCYLILILLILFLNTFATNLVISDLVVKSVNKNCEAHNSTIDSDKKTINDNSSPKINSIFNIYANAIYGEKNIVYIYSNQLSELAIYDISNLENSKQIGKYEWGNAKDFRFDKVKMKKQNDSLIIVGSFTDGDNKNLELIILNVSNPKKPIKLGEYFSANKDINDFTINNNRIYIGYDFTNQSFVGFEILDIADFSHIHRIGEVLEEANDPAWIIFDHDVGIYENLVYLSLNDSIINVYNTTNPNNITKINIGSFNNMRNFEIYCNYLYTSGRDILNITNPYNITSFHSTGSINSDSFIFRFGEWFLISNYGFHIEVFAVNETIYPYLQSIYINEFIDYQIYGMGTLDRVFFYDNLLFIQYERLHIYNITTGYDYTLISRTKLTNTIIISMLVITAIISAVVLIIYRQHKKQKKIIEKMQNDN